MKTRPSDLAEDSDETPDIDICSQDLINAVHAKDVKGVSDALKAAFETLESMPHDEAPQPDEEEA